MSIPKKGSRKIAVDGEPFVWYIRKKVQWYYPDVTLNVAVEHAEKLGATLAINTDRFHPECCLTIVSSNNKRKLLRKPVRPSDVARWIRQGIDAGWQPRRSGKPFQVKVTGESLEII